MCYARRYEVLHVNRSAPHCEGVDWIGSVPGVGIEAAREVEATEGEATVTVRFATVSGSLYEVDWVEPIRRLDAGVFSAVEAGVLTFFNLPDTLLVVNGRVRRLEGSHDPTPRQGADGSWRDAEAVLLPDWTREDPVMCPAVIVWRGTEATVTSIIEGIVEIS